MAGAASRTIEVARTALVESGAGTPVVLVHGSLGDARVWEAQRDNIARHCRYLALHLRYHGRGPWPDEGRDYSVTAHATQVAGVLQALHVGPVNLIGQSYGGHVALRVALQVPGLVRTLVLQEPAIESLVTGPEAEAINAERQRAFGPAVGALRQGKPDVAARLFVEALLNQGPGTFDAAPDHLKSMVADNTRTLPLMLAAPPPPPITCSQLGTLRTPTLVINGASTLRFYSFAGERVAQCIPGARRVVMDGASHAVETQAPQAFWAAVGKFIGG